MNTELYGPLAMNHFEQQMFVKNARMWRAPEGFPGVRPGTEFPIIRDSFVFGGAGMGDFICYMPALMWIAKNCPGVEGRIYCAGFFMDFAREVMKPWNWAVFKQEDQIKVDKPSVFTGPG